jgi:hypothetical protein
MIRHDRFITAALLQHTLSPVHCAERSLAHFLPSPLLRFPFAPLGPLVCLFLTPCSSPRRDGEAGADFVSIVAGMEIEEQAVGPTRSAFQENG